MPTPPCSELLYGASRSDNLVVAAVADNCRFDERTGTERWRRFEALLPEETNGVANWDDWAEANRLHLERYCNVAGPAVPDAFLDVNQGAWLVGLSENQSLVRVEDLRRALRDSGLDLRGLGDLLQRADEGDDDASQAVRGFFRAWNDRRDARPAFAAFGDDVQEELNDADWPHALRDRLGLGHYSDPEGQAQPIPVALMCYSVADVWAAQKKRQLPTVCALPTVLDGGMHEFFFPVPTEHPFGATVHLVCDKADTLTAEVLHCRLDYERSHLYGLGEVTRFGRPDDDQLREARDLHLYALQEACGREDFGEPLEGRQ